MPPLSSIVPSFFAMLVCGGLGAVAGYAAVHALGWSGTLAAIVAVTLGMVVATLVFALGVAALRKLGWLR